MAAVINEHTPSVMLRSQPSPASSFFISKASFLVFAFSKRFLTVSFFYHFVAAIAYISAAILEGAREGKTVAELMSYGKTILNRDEVMTGIPEMIHEVQVEATFPDGTKLVTVHNPIQ